MKEWIAFTPHSKLLKTLLEPNQTVFTSLISVNTGLNQSVKLTTPSEFLPSLISSLEYTKKAELGKRLVDKKRMRGIVLKLLKQRK